MNTETPGFDNPMMKPFVEFWSRFAKDAAGAAWNPTLSPASQFNPASVYREWEQRWLDTMSESCDAYLRSPHFMEWMRHHSDFVVKSKQQADNVAQEFARNAGIPTASDISGLYERLHSFEDNLVRRLDRELLKRTKNGDHGTNGDLGIEGLSKRLDRLESSVLASLERIERRLDASESGRAAVASRPANRARTVSPTSKAGRTAKRSSRAKSPPKGKPNGKPHGARS